MTPKVHVLKNGSTLIVMSPGHGFKFSDGTVAEAQHKELCDLLTLERQFVKVGEINGMALNSVSMKLTEKQKAVLLDLCDKADIIMVPFMVIQALRDQQIRELFPNCVAFNATADTQRSAPQDKIVDINNWSY